jgi:16S rRNA (cytosine967-C5)-methyltransferase
VSNTPRQVAAQTLAKVLHNQRSLSGLLPAALEKLDVKERALLQELCYGSMRWFPQLQLILSQLLDKPLKPKDSDIHALLIIGLYQLLYMRIPDHAAIDQSVEVTRRLKKNWASKLVNGILRNAQRQQEALKEQLQDNPVFSIAHPKWLIKAIENAWGDRAADIFAANNAHPPFTLRLNLDRLNREEYLSSLPEDLQARAGTFSPHAITLGSACDVFSLPGFSNGDLSVQDEAAQFAAGLLDLQSGHRVLDACCAPGGKTGHILESQTDLDQVFALDSDERRLVRVEENLARLQKPATLLCGDARRSQDWWDEVPFDRILLDAPCSGTGVIRRHPDIKLLRKPADIVKLATLQLEILTELWSLLKPGGRLVYATCSIMPEENTQVIEAFLDQTENATESKLNTSWGIEQTCGRQLFPSIDGHDGFYYAVLDKTNK